MTQSSLVNIPKFIGHRGVKDLAPENTLESIIKAIKSSGYKKVIPFNKIEIINLESGAPIVLLNIDLVGDCK